MPTFDRSWVVLLFCGWLAGTISGVAGFGGTILLLPVVSLSFGPRSAVPVLTVAQLLGNLSRAGFGWRDIRWRPSLVFSLGCIPGCLAGGHAFLALPRAWLPRIIGGLLCLVVLLRHSARGRRPIPERLLAPAGVGVGFLSALAGSAGPLGAAVFLSLKLPPRSYVATDAVTAVVMHAIKALVYGRNSALSPQELGQGLLLGSSLIVGSWTGRKLLDRVPEQGFAMIVEYLLLLSAMALVFHSFD